MAALAQSVVIDGTTTTNVVIDPTSGAVTVGIAPTTPNGVSLNKYDKFNVPSSGLKLDNRTQAARTIVNEVTGSSRTEIKGTVEVLGQRSHVIIANPNGIAIDGGRFVNTGRVGLTTGPLSTTAKQIAPGIFRDDVTSTITNGTGSVISISGGGLSGQMDAVDLIAHKVKIDGPITNSSTNTNSGIRVAAGQSRTEFDSSILPGNTAANWANIVSAGAISSEAVLVEITSQGALTANRIGIEVSDKGPGVRIAGKGYATSRSFTLTADGLIDLSDAKIKAQNTVLVTGPSVKLDRAQITAMDSFLNVIATDANGSGITGVDFTLMGQNVGLRSEADIDLQTANDFTDTNGIYTAAKNLTIRSDKALSFDGTTLASGLSTTLQSTRALSFKSTQVTATDNLLITADNVDISNGTRRSEFRAGNGSLIATTLGTNSNGDLTNTGGLLQGAVKTDGLRDNAGTLSEGGVTLNIKGNLKNTTTADELAIIVGTAGNVSVRTGGNIENNRGRIVSTGTLDANRNVINGDINFIAAGDVLNILDLPRGTVDPEIIQYTKQGKRQWWTLWIKRKRETYVSYDYGVLENTDQLAAITASGNVSIQAQSLLNQGAQINANGGDIEVKALRVETIGVGSGKVSVRRVCVLSCSYESTGNTVSYFGGSISAAQDINIEATEQFRNYGGAVLALRDLTLTSDNVVLQAALVPSVITRPRGLYSFWSSKAAWLLLRDQFGSIIADTGKLTVKSKNPVKLIGGTLSAGGTTDLENGQDIVRRPTDTSDALNQTIGFFQDAPLVRQ